MNLKFLVSLFLFFSLSSLFAQVDTLTVFSKGMQKEIKNVVLLPDNYPQSTQEFPVVYLLHGAGGGYKSWVQLAPAIKEYANRYQQIIVCPDGSKTSWYFDSPKDPSSQYETYIIKELLTAVDKKYKTIKSKKGRAITGLSMGGHGALYLSLKHTDLFGAAGSMSGGVDIRPFSGWDIPKRLGTYAENKEIWEKNTVINMLHLLRNDDLKIIIDCGTSDFFLEVNEKLHEKMRYLNIPHDFTLRPGAHNGAYWINSIKYHLLFFDDYFNQK